MVFNIAPNLPLHPIFEGKFIKPFNSLFRSPFRPDCVNASKVSASVHSRSTDVCRLDLDAAASTAGPMDSVSMVWSVSAWLHDASAYLVSRFDFLRLIDLYSFDLNPAASTPRSIDPIATFQREFRSLRGPGTSAVSRFALSCWFLIDTLDLDLYRFDLHVDGSTAGSNDPIQTFRVVWRWLHDVLAYPVSRFDFMRLADFSRYGFDSSMSTARPNKSVQTICMVDGWLGRHK